MRLNVSVFDSNSFENKPKITPIFENETYRNRALFGTDGIGSRPLTLPDNLSNFMTSCTPTASEDVHPWTGRFTRCRRSFHPDVRCIFLRHSARHLCRPPMACSIYRVAQKTGPLCYIASNFRNTA